MRRAQRGAGAAIVAAAAIAGGGSVASCRMERPPYDPRNDPGDVRPPALSLALKAERYERDLDRFVSPEGLLLYRIDRRAASAAAGSGEPAYGDLADQACWGGCLLAAEAARAAVTGDGAARRRALDALAGQRLLLRITGVPGLLARCVAPARAPFVTGAAPEKEWHVGEGDLRAFAWRGNVSKDQYAGWLLGHAVAWADLAPLDAGAARGIADDAGAVARMLLRNDLVIRDLDGEPTTFGDMDGFVAGVPIGVNAAIALLALRLGAEATGEEAIAEGYHALVEDGYIQATCYAHVEVLGIVNPNNDNMATLALHGLLLHERDPERRAALVRSLGRLWNANRGRGNALLAIVAAAHGAAGEEAVEEARRSLRGFPAEKVARAVDLRGRREIERFWLPSRGHEMRAAEPVPVELRPVSSFLWKSDPYALFGNLGLAGEIEYSGVDYLLPYWIGRRFGLIGAEE